LRAFAGVSTEEFGEAFGVSPNIVERWETLGVSSGPTSLALRFVAREMDFEFPTPEPKPGTDCTICGAAAVEDVHGFAVCTSCHRDPVASMEAVGFEVTSTENHVAGTETIHIKLPAGRTLRLRGQFMSEGIGTMLAKLFKQEPEIGEPAFDDAVYIQDLDLDDVAELEDPAVQETLISLVAYGVAEIGGEFIDVQHALNWGEFDNEIILMSGLLASRLSS
jgi:hypothetical protein